MLPCMQGSTGVLKTSCPLGRGFGIFSEAHPKIFVGASDFLLIAHAAPECIVASLFSG